MITNSYQASLCGNNTVLFWVPGGMPLMLHVEGAIAKALQLRGVNSHAVICDGTYQACMLREIKNETSVQKWKDTCSQCKASNSAILEAMNVPYSYIGDFVSESSLPRLREIAKTVSWETLHELTFEGINIGKNAFSSAVRYLQGLYDPNTDLNKDFKEIAVEYAFSALVCATAAGNATKRLLPSKVFMSHGIYVDWGPALTISRDLGIMVTLWRSSHLSSHFYFGHNRDKFRNSLDIIAPGEWEDIKHSPLTPEQDNRLALYVKGRYLNNESFDIKKPVGYIGDSNYLKQKLGLTNDRPIWGIFTHLLWDASADSGSNAYPTYEDWTIDTIQEIIKIPDIQWVIKIHPSEIWHKSVGGVLTLLERYFSALPSHVKVITAEEQVSPLDFIELIDGGVSIRGTAGLELAMIGKPVILAGEAYYGNKGFTHDGLTPEAYRKLLKKAKSLTLLGEKQLQQARKYAYCHFFQRQIPFPVVNDPGSSFWCFQNDKAHLLYPGNDPFTDFICDRIMDGKDFIMDEKLVALAAKERKKESLTNKANKDSASTFRQSSTVDTRQPKTDHLDEHPLPSKLLGFDPGGEVFKYKGRILRGIFNGAGHTCQKTLEACLKYNLFEAGIVKTSVVNGNELSKFGYDMILEHEKIPYITYAHEWASEMLKDAALFELGLNAELNNYGMMLKDCGVTSNILFKGSQPVYVDFLSLISHDELRQQDWLIPSAVRTPFQPLWSHKSTLFNEIFSRMFYPYMLLPLYMMHQKRFSEARRRMLETALNTCSEVITEQEAFGHADISLIKTHQHALAAREYALVTDDWPRFLGILQDEIKQLTIAVDHSDYSGYYEQKGETFGFEPCGDWGPKQRTVYDALHDLRPDTVLDIGANTGWFSILAARSGCRVVAMDSDEASMCLLYKRSKEEGLPILPLVMDITKPTPDVPASPDLANDPHMVSSRIAADAPLLFSAVNRLKSEMVLALAIVHHLTLGLGLGLNEVVELLASLSRKHLVVEFVAKEDPLIVGEMDFFPAFHKNPSGFEWYTKENWLHELSRHYRTVEPKVSTGQRVMFVCSDKK